MLSEMTIKDRKYPGEITVNLEPLTVFIGPNGCGKSTVVKNLAEHMGEKHTGRKTREDVDNIITHRDFDVLLLVQLLAEITPSVIPFFDDLSDGEFNIFSILATILDVDAPDVLCFEEPENGIHPWLLHKIMELLNKVSIGGIGDKPKQVLITTHSPVLLNYVQPEQVRVVELDDKGRTQVHPLPLDSRRLQLAMEAYENEIGELWFTNLFGGNPK